MPLNTFQSIKYKISLSWAGWCSVFELFCYASNFMKLIPKRWIQRCYFYLCAFCIYTCANVLVLGTLWIKLNIFLYTENFPRILTWKIIYVTKESICAQMTMQFSLLCLTKITKILTSCWCIRCFRFYQCCCW